MELAIRVTTDAPSTKIVDNIPVVRERFQEDIVVAISSEQIHAKWLEILCDLMAPSKIAKFSNFKYVVESSRIWTPSLKNLFEDYKFGRKTLSEAWGELTSDGFVVGSMPTTYGKSVLDTWVWGSAEERVFGLAYFDDTGMTDVDVKNLASVVEVPSQESVRVLNSKRVDSTAMGITSSEISALMDIDVAVPVDHSRVFEQTAIVSTF